MFGTKVRQADVDLIIDEFVGIGGNLVDTANVYGRGVESGSDSLGGEAELSLRSALARHRHELLVATKGYWLTTAEHGPNRVGLSRSHLLKSVDDSLRRLGVDHVDLFQCHVWDFYTPIDETLRTLDDLVRLGKVRYLGASNWDGWHVLKSSMTAAATGLTPLISNQIWYNILDRGVESSIIPACRDQGVGIIAWGALAQGFLSGRYERHSIGPDRGSRIESTLSSEPSSWGRLATDRNWGVIDSIREIALAHDVRPGLVALRWLLDVGKCDVAIVGGSTVEQIHSLMQASSISLTREEVQSLTMRSAPDPSYPTSFYDLFCYRHSPFYGGHRIAKDLP